jgi:hypothetical protein
MTKDQLRIVQTWPTDMTPLARCPICYPLVWGEDPHHYRTIVLDPRACSVAHRGYR